MPLERADDLSLEQWERQRGGRGLKGGSLAREDGVSQAPVRNIYINIWKNQYHLFEPISL